MKKFIVLYHAPQGAADTMAQTTPEEAKAGMEPWMKWAQKVGKGMVDLGTPLGNGRTVTRKGAAPSQSTVVGYSILQANTLDQAVELLKGHPHLDWMDACEVEVHESFNLPGT